MSSSCNTLGGLTYVRGIVMAMIGSGTTDPRISHESITVSIAINVQPARSIDENLLCVFHQYLVKEA